MYEFDIFLSYARRNNVAGWVTEFRNALQSALLEKPQLPDVSIFMDEKDISGGEPFDSRILGSLAKSAVLLIIVSEASLDPDREWCHRECQEFIRHAGGPDKIDGRIYLVNYDGIDPTKLPPEIRHFTPYTFFERDRKTDDIRPGALIERGSGRFHTELYNLRRDLIGAFHKVRAPSLKQAPNVVAVRIDKVGNHQPRQSVFLAEAIPGTIEQDQYAQVESALMQRVNVVPGRRSYYSAYKGFEDEVDEYLENSDLFVQLLSTQRWPPSPNFELGYERWLYERAKSQNIPILRWQSGKMDLTSVEDPEYLDFLNLAEPKICDLSEFIPLVFDELSKQETREKFDSTRDSHPVLMMADYRDESLCDNVGAQIEQIGSQVDFNDVEPELVIASGDKEIDVFGDATSLAPSGLVIVWDRGPLSLVQELLKQCRRYRRTREIDPPACAIVVPSLESHSVNHRPPRFAVISSEDRDGLKQYVEQVCGVP